MNSLLLRIFLSFWLIIVLIILSAATAGFLYAERARASLQSFEVSDAMLEASESLQTRGRDGLIDWLNSLPSVTASLVFVIDERGRDLLDRRLPPPVELAMRRSGQPDMRRPPPRGPGNLRPARPFAELVSPDGEVFTLIVLPPQSAVGRWVTERSRLSFVVIALLASGGVSYLLARAISGPIRRFRESTVAIAGGDLDTRIDERIEQRRDEIGGLAQDFNRMVRKLQLAWRRQAELTSNVSHELRSPLARLKIALELARRQTGDLPELDRIDVETEKLDVLVGQLLTLSRLDTGQGEPEVVNLSELVAGVHDDVRFEFPDQDIELTQEDGVFVDGFATALRSAVENVLRNAAIHGRKSVRLQLTVDSSSAVIVVSDHGGGVPEDSLKQLFDAFYRVPGQSPGSGLGLAIAARAVAMHGGTITARNDDTGLMVEIRIPISAV
ncbi:MAG: ATP-binding protein [Pseudomonadota bacterium]